MDRVSLLIFIVQLLCGLACIGVGIYYIVTGSDAIRIVIFMVVGVACFGMAARTFITARKERKGEDSADGDNRDGKD